MKFERERYDVLVNGIESKALRHLFLAERAAAKISDIPGDVKAAEIRKVAVIGAGTMGGGIAMSFASAGIPVIVVETKQEALDRGLAMIRKNYAGTVAKGKLAQDEADRRIGRIQPSLDLAAVAEADLVIEAVFEDMDVKKECPASSTRCASPTPSSPRTPLGSTSTRSRQHVAARFGDRPAFLQPRQRDAPGGGRARRLTRRRSSSPR